MPSQGEVHDSRDVSTDREINRTIITKIIRRIGLLDHFDMLTSLLCPRPRNAQDTDSYKTTEGTTTATAAADTTREGSPGKEKKK